MDAGIAGLIGALGGGIVGAAGASVAGLITLRGARYQADRQSQAAHEQWLRQIRRDAYAAFLVQAREAVDRLRGALPPGGGDLAALGEAVNGMHRAMGALLLEAPERIWERAATVHRLARHSYVMLKIGDWNDEQRMEARQALLREFEVLVLDCQRSLQNPDAFPAVER